MPPDRPAHIAPILFSAPMIRALLAGRKTQSRRLPTPAWRKVVREVEAGRRVLLWVREAFARYPYDEPPDAKADIWFRAEGRVPPVNTGPNRWRPGIHMPRWASRLTLEVQAAVVERLCAMTVSDVLAEGVLALPDDGLNPDFRFPALWDGLHAAPGARWADNPDVVALTFAVRRGNVDEVLADA